MTLKHRPDMIWRAWYPVRLATTARGSKYFPWRWGTRVLRLWRGRGYEYYPTWYVGD